MFASFALAASAQVTGTVTSAATGEPIADVLVMGSGIPTWVRTDAAGHYSLQERGNAPISFRREGYRPVTRIATGPSLDITLEDGRATEWKIPFCKDLNGAAMLCGRGLTARTRKDFGGEIRFYLPCEAKAPKGFQDVDYSGEIVPFPGGKGAVLETMVGPHVSSGRPYFELYKNSASFEERGWQIRYRDRIIDGLDARGGSKDGTFWRWVGPILGEFATYRGASADAAKYFDAILDSACFHAR